VDIILRNAATGQNAVWYMNGAAYAGYDWIDAVTDLSWQIVGVGDFNRDGKHDILWRNAVKGQNAVWYLDGARYAGYSYIESVADLNWLIINR
jgi:hypothetical protein